MEQNATGKRDSHCILTGKKQSLSHACTCGITTLNFFDHRKNPAHFKEYSHDFSSVDSIDTNSGDESDDSERPLCPYGADCYRCGL